VDATVGNRGYGDATALSHIAAQDFDCHADRDPSVDKKRVRHYNAGQANECSFKLLARKLGSQADSRAKPPVT